MAAPAAAASCSSVLVMMPPQELLGIVTERDLVMRVLAKGLDLKPETVIAQDIQDAGNTSAASIPLAMFTLLNSGEAKPGSVALLLGYGAGLAYAAQVIRLPG